MGHPKRELQQLGAVTTLVQAARDHRFRSVAVAGLYADASPLAEKMAVDLHRGFGLSTTLFQFEAGRHRWRKFIPANLHVHQEVPSKARAAARNYPSPMSLALESQPEPAGETGAETLLASDVPFDLLRETVQELEEATSMLVLSAPPLITDPQALTALSLVPRVILEVPAQADRQDLIAAGTALESMNIELLGAVLTGYRNPLPKWLDFLLGYR